MPYVLGGETPRQLALRELLAPYRGVTRQGFFPAPTTTLRGRLVRSSVDRARVAGPAAGIG